MQFCEKCGTLLTAKEDDEDAFICEKCGTEVRVDEKAFTTSQDQEKELEVAVLDENNEALPKTKAPCEECGHLEAFYWVEQTRSADEAPTRFYKCVKCSHTWREYS